MSHTNKNIVTIKCSQVESTFYVSFYGQCEVSSINIHGRRSSDAHCTPAPFNYIGYLKMKKKSIWLHHYLK